MNKNDLLGIIRSGTPVRWVPRSMSGIRPTPHERAHGFDERDLYIGERRARDSEETMAVELCMRGGLCKCLEQWVDGTYRVGVILPR